MTNRDRFRPFTGETSKPLRLQSNPLALVLCQIRWPELNHLQGNIKEMAVAFGASLGAYPIYEELQEMSYELTPSGVQQRPGETLHRWSSLNREWHVMLSRRFVSIYATTYEAFDEVIVRLREVLEAVETSLRVPIVERVGVRYVNRFPDVDIASTEYLRPEVLGYAALPTSSPDAVIQSSINQIQYTIGDVGLRVRSGLIPANETVDPAVPPLMSPSWVLDLDAFSEQPFLLEPEAAIAVAGKLSDAAYDYFRLVVTEGFVTAFGGVHE